MQLPERLIRLFDYPVGDILAAMPDVSDPLWEANPHRQTKHAVHRETRSIISIGSMTDGSPASRRRCSASTAASPR